MVRYNIHKVLFYSAILQFLYVSIERKFKFCASKNFNSLELRYVIILDPLKGTEAHRGHISLFQVSRNRLRISKMNQYYRSIFLYAYIYCLGKNYGRAEMSSRIAKEKYWNNEAPYLKMSYP